MNNNDNNYLERLIEIFKQEVYNNFPDTKIDVIIMTDGIIIYHNNVKIKRDNRFIIDCKENLFIKNGFEDVCVTYHPSHFGDSFDKIEKLRIKIRWEKEKFLIILRRIKKALFGE